LQSIGAIRKESVLAQQIGRPLQGAEKQGKNHGSVEQ
jgi:hypothetical protein